MVTDNAIAGGSWALVIFVTGAISISSLLLILSRFLGGRSKGHSKHEPFESGITPVGTSRLRISIKFYLVAIAFLIFEAEALFLYSYAISVRETGWAGFIGATVFIIILLVGLIYEARMGGLKIGGQAVTRDTRPPAGN